MKDNIDTKNVITRKIIIELKYTPIAKILDCKGTIADGILKRKIFTSTHWEINNNLIVFRDNEQLKDSKYLASVEFNRIHFSCMKIDSIDSFFNTFTSFYETIMGIVGSADIVRIGCRVIGAYKPKSTQYESLLKNFVNLFPQTLYLKEYSPKSLNFRLDYQNGMYNIATLSNETDFYAKEFYDLDKKNPIGIMLDIDSYLQKIDDVNINTLAHIKKVCIASLAVEKSLLDNLKDL